MAKNEKNRSARTGAFRDSIRVRSSHSGTQYVHPVDIFLSDKVAAKMKRVNEVFSSSESGRLVAKASTKSATSSKK